MKYKPNMSFSEHVFSLNYVATTILPNWHVYANELRQAENWFIDNDLVTAIGITNVATEFHTPYLSHRLCPLFDNLHSAIHSELMHNEKIVKGVQNSEIKDYLEVGESWIAKYNEGEATAKHFHYPYHMVSTFYYDVEVSTPLIIEYYDDEGLQQKFIEVTNGLLILLPGDMMHSVPTVKGARSMVASNWFYNLDKYNEHLLEKQTEWLKKGKKSS